MQLKASITSDMPYFLEQIQQGANYLMLAAERMATVDQHDHALVTTVEVRGRMVKVWWKIKGSSVQSCRVANRVYIRVWQTMFCILAVGGCMPIRRSCRTSIRVSQRD